MEKDAAALITELTGHLFSSLDMETALHRTFACLARHFPLDLIHLLTVDLTADTLRYLAEATENRGILLDEKVQVSPQAMADIRSRVEAPIWRMNRSESPLLEEVYQRFRSHVAGPEIRKGNNYSVLVLGFGMGGELIGAFGMVARGKDSYDRGHESLLREIRKPLLAGLLNLFRHRDVLCRNERLAVEKQQLQDRLGYPGGMVGRSPALQAVQAMIRQVAPLRVPVLLFGETGTGKEVAASAIHRASGRADGPMIRVNCGAIAENLLDSELFGHEKGAFTGAMERKRGFFEQADGGTLFLDEIGELPLAAQVKLLRVLQSMEFFRVGGQRPIAVDTRVIAATHRDLYRMVEEGRFREDLWFRLNVFPIRIPPLRERLQDMEALALHFIRKKSREMNFDPPPELSSENLQSLQRYAWPGNIRELENVMERALILGRGRGLSFAHLGGGTQNFSERPGEAQEAEETGRTSEGIKDFLTLEEAMRRHILAALDLCCGRIDGPKGAAGILAIHPSTLRSRMKKMGIVLERRAETHRPDAFWG
jgi:transcriptional regulator with GAF, ATPase, and Fis domain